MVDLLVFIQRPHFFCFRVPVPETIPISAFLEQLEARSLVGIDDGVVNVSVVSDLESHE